MKPCFFYTEKNNHYIVDTHGIIYGEGSSDREALEDYLCQGYPVDKLQLNGVGV